MISPYVYPGTTMVIKSEQDTAAIIIDKLSAMAGVDVRMVSRKREVVEARQVAMFLLRKLTRLSLEEIGFMFNKNHATVVYSSKTVITLYASKSYRAKYEGLFNQFNIKVDGE